MERVVGENVVPELEGDAAVVHALTGQLQVLVLSTGELARHVCVTVASAPEVTSPPGRAVLKDVVSRVLLPYDRVTAYRVLSLDCSKPAFSDALRSACRAGLHGSPRAVPDSRIQCVIDAIDAHLDNPRLGLAFLARAVNLSSWRLAHVFKNVIGAPTRDVIARRRVARAAELLVSTHLSMKQIAAAVGYERTGGLDRAFVRHTGMTPRDFRGRHAATIVANK